MKFLFSLFFVLLSFTAFSQNDIHANTYEFDGYEAKVFDGKKSLGNYTYEIEIKIEIDYFLGHVRYDEGEFISYYKIKEVLPVANGKMLDCGATTFTITTKEVVKRTDGEDKIVNYKNFYRNSEN